MNKCLQISHIYNINLYMCEFLLANFIYYDFNYKYYYMKNSYDRVRLNQIFFFFPQLSLGKKFGYTATRSILKKHYVMELGKKL